MTQQLIEEAANTTLEVADEIAHAKAAGVPATPAEIESHQRESRLLEMATRQISQARGGR